MSSPDNEWHLYKHKRNNANVELRYFCCLIFLRLLLSTFSFKFFILPWTHLSIFILLRNFLSEIAFLVNTYCLLYTVRLLTMENSQDNFRPKTEISFLLHHFQRNMVRKVFNSNVSAITGAYRPDFLLHLFQSTFKEERRKKKFLFQFPFFPCFNDRNQKTCDLFVCLVFFPPGFNIYVHIYETKKEIYGWYPMLGETEFRVGPF